MKKRILSWTFPAGALGLALAASERGETWFSPSIRREQLEDFAGQPAV